jgi:hypothetical protein
MLLPDEKRKRILSCETVRNKKRAEDFAGTRSGQDPENLAKRIIERQARVNMRLGEWAHAGPAHLKCSLPVGLCT